MKTYSVTITHGSVCRTIPVIANHGIDALIIASKSLAPQVPSAAIVKQVQK